MSKGPGTIESRIADLFAATRDRALSIDEITDNAYQLGGARPTRAQRLSATRAAHRLLRRVRELSERAHKLRATDEIKAKGLDKEARRISVWVRFVKADRAGYIKAEEDYWCTATIKGRLFFYPPDAPLQVWAVSIQPAGVIWAEAEVCKITERFVMVRYAGVTARLHRDQLWHWWAWWRGVQFASSRTGRIANKLDQLWQERYGARGGGPAAMRMPLATARQLLGLSADADYTKADVLAAFRRAAKKAHPDVGGTEEMFRLLVEARDRLLAAIGTSAPAPKPPTYAPEGVRVVYRTGRSASRLPRIDPLPHRLSVIRGGGARGKKGFHELSVARTLLLN
jgi:hypothetical protein